ncbi:MAG TPA: TetR family transcriptional regulator [Jiangellales bacterium]|nr:TetR family transcriptional regulator [Jiangellales bacterium]
MTSPAGVPVSSLRDRKKLRTRRLLQSEALRLFAERGYEATTVEDIAAAAEVSPRTFFRYFASKEAVVLEDEYDPLLFEELARIDPAEPPIRAMRRIIDALLPDIYAEDRDRILARTTLVYSTPHLRSAVNTQLAEFEAVVAETLAGVHGRAPDDLEARVVAAVAVAAMRCAIEQWVAGGGEPDLGVLLDQAFDVVERGLTLT